MQRNPPEPSRRTRHHRYYAIKSSNLKCGLKKGRRGDPSLPIVNSGRMRDGEVKVDLGKLGTVVAMGIDHVMGLQMSSMRC
ncbi:hypothetical protein M3J09_010965 [Ascochyta lentis]